MNRTGHCLCGRVRFAFSGEPLWVAHCHCESCRRATASAFTTYVGVPALAASFAGEAPKTYVSSPGALRRFCGVCGAQVSFESDRWPGEIHFFAALLDDPLSVTPQIHVNVAERLAWIALADGLPCKAGTDG